MTRCSCMHPAPIIVESGEAFTVRCWGCGGSLNDKASPDSDHQLAGIVGYALERRGNAFLSVAENQWLEARHRHHDLQAERSQCRRQAANSAAEPAE